jgi:RimJ/RimL family protein N-acetyltransferase
MFEVQPVTLTGKLVRLEPLSMDHIEDLFETAQDPDIWTYMSADPSRSVADMQAWVAAALHKQQIGSELPFAIRDLACGYLCGSTRYIDIVSHDRGLEIGSTWLGVSARRTGINTECKYLLLNHAFETLGAIRVQFKTHHNNLRSQRAIERIGGIKEGTLRNHKIMPDGHYRHSVYFSIVESEWPAVKANLLEKMARG